MTDIPQLSTDSEELRKRFMDPCRLGSEADWWAKRRIEELEREVESLKASMYGHYELETERAALLADIEVLLNQVEVWKHTAEQHLRNEQFYQSLLDNCAFHLGPETFVSDDGSVQDSPIMPKIPEMVAALLADNERLRKALETISALGILHIVNGSPHWIFPLTVKGRVDTALTATPEQSLDTLLNPYKAHIERLRDALKFYASKLTQGDVAGTALTITPAQSLDALLDPYKAHIERLSGALEKISDWAKAYPLSVFPEPDFKRAGEVLKAAGMTLDAISASNMRHVIVQVQGIVDAALTKVRKET